MENYPASKQTLKHMQKGGSRMSHQFVLCFNCLLEDYKEANEASISSSFALF